MRLIRFEQNVVPNNPEGRKFAYEYEKRLKRQGTFKVRIEDGQTISIHAEYTLDIKMEDEEV